MKFNKFFKKIIGFTICTFIILSQFIISGSVFASTDDAVKIFYRDYEDYTGGASFLNKTANSADYGTATGVGTGSFANAVTKTSGKNGAGVCFNPTGATLTGATAKLTFNKELSSGILYTAFDAKFSEASRGAATSLAATYIKLFNKEETPAYGFLGIAQDDYTLRMGATANTGWDANKINDFTFNTTNTYRIEVTYNLNTKVCNYYVDGVLLGTKTTTKGNDGINAMEVRLSNLLEYFDNFTVMHYPNGIENDSYITVKTDGTEDGDYIIADFKDFTTGGSVLINNLTPENVTVKNNAGQAVEVVKIESFAQTGKYKITLSDKLSAGLYTLTFSDSIGDTVDKKLNANTSEFTVSAKKIFYRDYEDYTGGALFLNKTANSADYGSATGNAPGTFAYTATKTSGKNGAGVCFNPPGVTGTNATPTLTFNKELSSGILYTAFDAKFSEASKGAATSLAEAFIKLYNKEETTPYGFVAISKDRKLYMGSTNGNGWDVNQIDDFTFDTKKTYKIEVTYNLNTKVCDYYVDGALLGSKTTTKGNDGIKAMQIKFSNHLEYFDNFTVMHYPVSVAEDASMTANYTAVAGENKIILNVTDSVLGSGQVVNAIKDSSGITIKNSNNEDLAVTSITDGEKTGEYVITLAQNISAGNYIAQIKNTITDTIGKPFENYTTQFTAEVLKPSANVVLNNNTATVTYKNFTSEYNGKVYAAAYKGNLMIAVAAQDVDTNNGNIVIVTVPDEYSSDTNITYKVFIWNDNLIPLGSYN